MSYSLSEAATACGVYKSTILRSIKAGRLTGTKDALGQWRIEPAELHRVYPPAGSNGAQNNGTRLHAMTALLEAQHRATLAEVQLAQLRTVLEDMRGDRDHWRTYAGATQRLLVDATARRPWWKRVAALVRPAASPRSCATAPAASPHSPPIRRASPRVSGFAAAAPSPNRHRRAELFVRHPSWPFVTTLRFVRIFWQE